MSNCVAKRTAIDWTGRLGSLYDAHRDQVIGSLNDKYHRNSSECRETVQCEIVRGNKDLNQNILKMISIDDDSRLSILLNLRGKTGVAAITDYGISINEYTRFFCYIYKNRTQELSNNLNDTEREEVINRIKSQKQATHIIASVDWGINIIAVLQLPATPDSVTEIDGVLQRLCTFLLCEYNSTPLDLDQNILSKITNIKVYSNTPDLNNTTTLNNVFRYIEQNRNSTVDQPVSYTLRPITWLYPQYDKEGVKFVPLPADLTSNVEQYVLHITADMKILDGCVGTDMPKLLSRYLQNLVLEVQTQWQSVRHKCTKEIQRFSKLIFEARSGQIERSEIDESLKDNEQITIKNFIRNFSQSVDNLIQKGHFLNDLDRLGFQYHNVIEHSINQADTENIIERKLILDDQYDRVLCSTDLLNRNNPEQLKKLRRHLTDEYKKNSNIRLIYADFSYSSIEPHHIMILPLTKDDYGKNNFVKKEKLSSIEVQTTSSTSVNIEPTVSSSMKTSMSVSTVTKVDSTTPPLLKTQSSGAPSTNVQRVNPLSTKTDPSAAISLTSSTTETINILLLGETGVGKSTFINALVNYLTFETLDKAKSSKPIVVIPVSFIMTVGDNFEEHTVKFGNLNGSHSEDFDHPGQSVTQSCKSYLFHLNQNSDKKLHIIDTPGFGDTRGLDQDDRNMQYILEYISNFSHLNAICFLLKPNASRLDISFRTCLTQLFSLLGSNARNNIIFCFTNARSTFYTPGDTGPLLKKTLTSFVICDLPFKKDNTFCFDNESFRYLVALQDKIPFDDHQKQEYEMSWSTSVTQSNQLINYICQKLSPYHIDDELKSIKHAQFQIVRMIRPILEAIRNILRNLILHEMGLTKESIELYPKPIDKSTTTCLSCKPCSRQVGKFFIGIDVPHYIQKDCGRCRCPLNQHVPVYYVLEYKVANNPSKYDKTQLTNILHQLYHIGAEFAHFLIHTAYSTTDDLFLIGLVQMIMDENDFSNNQTSDCLNSRLANALRDIQSKYDHQFHEINQQQKNSKSSNIYDLIHTVRNCFMVSEQLIAYKKGQKTMLKQYEFEIPTI